MEVDKSLFGQSGSEQLSARLLHAARGIVDREGSQPMGDLFELVKAYAEHLSKGLLQAGYPEGEAMAQGWKTSWQKLHDTLQPQTDYLPAVATSLERNLKVLYRGEELNAAGEPLDAPTRTFYRTFIGYIEDPSVPRSATWLREDS